MITCLFVPCAMGHWVRGKVRAKHGIEGTTKDDCIHYLPFACYCAICQESNELFLAEKEEKEKAASEHSSSSSGSFSSRKQQTQSSLQPEGMSNRNSPAPKRRAQAAGQGSLRSSQQRASPKQHARTRQQSERSGSLQRLPKAGPGVKEMQSPYISELMLDGVTVQEKIGAGNFGDVYKGEWMGVTVALKSLKGRASPEKSQDFEQEAMLLKELRHPNIVSFFGIYVQGKQQYMAFQWCSGGALDTHLRQKLANGATYSTLTLLKMADDAAKGMMFLASRDIVHRDLALRNLLLLKTSGSVDVVVSDFGMSRLLEGDDVYSVSAPTKIAYRWAAPEAIKQGMFSSSSDVWSYGVTLWEIFSYGEKPYCHMSNQDVVEQVCVSGGKRLKQPEGCPDAAYQLMKRCWSIKPSQRPGFDVIHEELVDIMREEQSNGNREDHEIEEEEIYGDSIYSG